MILERADYFELTRAADRVRLAELALGEAHRRYQAVAQRVGLEPTKAYCYDDDTLTVEKIDGDSDRNG